MHCLRAEGFIPGYSTLRAATSTRDESGRGSQDVCTPDVPNYAVLSVSHTRLCTSMCPRRYDVVFMGFHWNGIVSRVRAMSRACAGVIYYPRNTRVPAGGARRAWGLGRGARRPARGAGRARGGVDPGRVRGSPLVLRGTETFTFRCYVRYRHAYLLCQNQKKVGERCAGATAQSLPMCGCAPLSTIGHTHTVHCGAEQGRALRRASVETVAGNK